LNYERGFQEGIEIGIRIGRINVCERLLKLPVTPRENLLAMSFHDLDDKVVDLETQLGLAK
jgi:hypothetical protein